MRVNNKQQDLNTSDDPAQLPNLGLTDDELDGIKGGPGTGPAVEIDPSFKWNHNETTVSDENDETQLADLRLTDAASGTVKGGDGVCHGVSVLAWARVDGVTSVL